jgi:hypothetical protein
MKYMLVIVGDESQRTDDDPAAQMQAWFDYSQALVDAGVLVSGEGLQPSSTATTLRMQDGERVLTDGPFAETKEQIGGFYVIDCKDLDEAIDWAAKLPSAERGFCEIRPVIAYDDVTDPEAERQGAAS